MPQRSPAAPWQSARQIFSRTISESPPERERDTQTTRSMRDYCICGSPWAGGRRLVGRTRCSVILGTARRSPALYLRWSDPCSVEREGYNLPVVFCLVNRSLMSVHTNGRLTSVAGVMMYTRQTVKPTHFWTCVHKCVILSVYVWTLFSNPTDIFLPCYMGQETSVFSINDSTQNGTVAAIL